MNRGGELAEALLVVAPVVGTERQVQAGGQCGADVCLSTAAIASICCCQRTRGQGCGHVAPLSAVVLGGELSIVLVELDRNHQNAGDDGDTLVERRKHYLLFGPELPTGFAPVMVV